MTVVYLLFAFLTIERSKEYAVLANVWDRDGYSEMPCLFSEAGRGVVACASPQPIRAPMTYQQW